MREFIYGRNPVYETLRAKRRDIFRLLIAEGVHENGRLAEILYTTAQRKIPCEYTPRPRLDKIASNHQGVILEASSYPYLELQDILDLAEERGEPLFVLILDTLQDPQNLGTLLRTAEAVGVHGIIIPLAHTAQVTPAVVNASSGASEHLAIARANLAQAIRELKKAVVWVIGLDHNGQNLDLTGGEMQKSDPLKGPLVVVVGSEGEGIRPLVKKSCDLLLRLPMQGQVESLNAAVAGSVVLYMAYLRRGGGSSVS